MAKSKIELLREQQQKAKLSKEKLDTKPIESIEQVADSVHKEQKKGIEKQASSRRKKRLYDETEPTKRTSIDYPMSIYNAVKRATIDHQMSFKDFVLMQVCEHPSVKKYLSEDYNK